MHNSRTDTAFRVCGKANLHFGHFNERNRRICAMTGVSLPYVLFFFNLPASHATRAFLPKVRVPIEIIMKYPRALTFACVIFTSSNVSALQALSLPANPAPSGRPTIVTVLGWTYRGCYTDSVDSRTLTGENWTGSLTPSRCASICSGYRYLALESSNEGVLSGWHN